MVDLGALKLSILTGVPEAIAELNRFNGTVDSLATTMDHVGKKMSMSITAPIVGMEAAIIKIGASYEAEMSKVSAISGATGTELDMLSEKAREIGANTSLSATQAAEGLEYMALAGWKTEEMLEGYDGIVNLALSSTMDLGRASDIVTDYLTAFGLSAKDAGHFADVMAYAMSNSNTTTEQLGEAYKGCAATAKAFGISMEETTSWLGKMADNGIKASEAGTALNAVWARLYGENKIANKALQEYNLSLYDAQGNAKGFTQVINEMQIAMANMSQEEQNVFLRNVAGTNHLSDFAAILGTSTDKVEEFTSALEGCDGASEEMAKTVQDNLKGSITILKSNIEEAALQLYELQDGVLRDLVDKLNDTVTAFNSLDDATKQQIIAIAGVTAAIGPLLIVTGALIKSVITLKGALLALLTNPIVATITAIGAALAYMAVKALDAKMAQAQLNEKLIETIELKNDLTEASDTEIKSLKEEQSSIKETISLLEGQEAHLEKNLARQKEIQKLKEQMFNSGVSETSAEYIALEEEYQKLIGENEKLTRSIYDTNASIEKQWGCVENLYDRFDAYEIRLKNIEEANELVEKCTTATSKAMAQQALELETTAGTAEALYEQYKVLNATEESRRENADLLNKIQKQLTSILGDNVLAYDEETQSMKINEKMLLLQIENTDKLSQSKQKLVNDLIQYGEEHMQAVRDETAAVLAGLEAQSAAYAAANISNQETAMINVRIASMKEEMELLDELLGERVNVAKGSGEAEEDLLKTAKDSYTQRKKLGELSLRDQIANLNELKDKYSEDAEDIIDINEFAQGEILDIIKELVEEEGLSLKDEIALYEESRDKFCSCSKDKKQFNDAISDAINDKVKELVNNLDELNDEELQNVKDTLQDIYNEYKDSKYDISGVMDELESAKEEAYDREVEYVKSTVDEILKERKRLYQAELDALDGMQDEELAKLQEQLDAIEAQEEAQARKKKEDSYISKLNRATTQEDYDSIYAEYQEWLQDLVSKDEKAALKAQMEEIKKSTKALRDELEAEYNTDVENYNNYIKFELEKAKVKKENAGATDEEITKIAQENLNTQKDKVIEAVNSMSKAYQDELPILQETFTGYGDALYIGITSRDADIRAYLASLYAGDIGRDISFSDFNKGITDKSNMAEKALNDSSNPSNVLSKMTDGISSFLGQLIDKVSANQSKVELVVNLDKTEIAREIYDPLEIEKARRG